jgi:hypothetical protein
MKTTAFGVSALAIVVMVFVALLQVVSVDTRAVSLQDTLHGAIEASLDTALSTRAYTIEDEDELVADVVQGVVLELDDPQAKLEVQVNEVDRILGIVSMKLTGRYPSVSGSESVVSVERTVILEHVANAPAPGTHTVIFKSPTGETVKSYTLTEKSQKLPYPGYIAGAGKTFLGWDRNGVFYANTAAGKTALQNLALDTDYLFTARIG